MRGVAESSVRRRDRPRTEGTQVEFWATKNHNNNKDDELEMREDAWQTWVIR